MVARTRVALVTGGTRGIGRAVTERLADSGIDVAAAYATDCVAAESVRDRCEKAGARRDRCIGWTWAIRTPVGASSTRCWTSMGGSTTSSTTPARSPSSATVTSRPDDWQRHLAVNLSAAFFLSQAAMGTMIERRFGRIVNIGSVSATMGSPVQIPYAAAKSGLIGLTRSTARAVARKGITVNCVIPGSFDTDLSEGLAFTARDVVTSMIPVGRWGRPEELAHAVSFPA